jgi:hypothetical protein
MPTAFAPPTCRHCRGLEADPTLRWLCPRCYHDPLTRACYSTSGERIADPPIAHVEEPDTTPAPAAGACRRRRRQDSERDDAGLLEAVQRLTAAGNYRTDGGRPAAGLNAALRAASLDSTRGAASVERLVAAGALVRVTVGLSKGTGRKRVRGLQSAMGEAG